MPTIAVTDATFQDQVLDSDTPVVVNFWAAWCGPCRMLAPVLEEIADEHTGDFTVVKVNIDENLAAVDAYRIMTVPTTVLIVAGQEITRVAGAKPKVPLLDDLLKPLAR